MLKSFKRSESFFCGNRTLTAGLFFIVEFHEHGIVSKEGRGARSKWLGLRGVQLIIKVLYGI